MEIIIIALVAGVAVVTVLALVFNKTDEEVQPTPRPMSKKAPVVTVKDPEPAPKPVVKSTSATKRKPTPKEATVIKTTDVDTAENQVAKLLCDRCQITSATPELINEALEIFLETRHTARRWSSWTHALSHLTQGMWSRRTEPGMEDWIKRLNLIAFEGTTAIGVQDCSSRLVTDFCQYAKWNEDPADFHITPENTSWMKEDEHNSVVHDRIARSPFESEEVFLRWEISHMSVEQSWSNALQRDEVRPHGCVGRIVRLSELKKDVSELVVWARDCFEALLNDYLSEQVSDKERADWQVNDLARAIDKIRADLDQLNNL